MNKLYTQTLLTVAFTLVAGCFEDGITELGIYERPSKVPPPSDINDSSVVVPIIDAGPVLPVDPELPLDPDTTCHIFTAHAADSTSPYAVEAGDDHDVRFTFTAPWQGTSYIRSVEPVIDSRVAVHHLTFHADASALPARVEVGGDAKHGGPLLYGWVPGNEALRLPYDMGIPVEGTVSYTLVVNYDNSGPATLDATGIKVCVTTRPAIFGVSLTQREEI